MDDGPSPAKGNAGDDSASRSSVGIPGSAEGRIDSIASELGASEFCELQQTRQILAGSNGEIAQVRRAGSGRQITHTRLGTEQIAANEVRLLSVSETGVTFWAKRDDAMSGVYRLDGSGLHNHDRLEEISDVRVSGERLLVSGVREGDRPDHVRYVTDDARFSLWKNDHVSLTPDGELILLTQAEIDGHARWLHRSWRDGRKVAERDVGYSPRIGVMPWRGGYCYTQDYDGAFRIWAPHDRSVNRTFREEDGKPCPTRCWSSPDGETMLHLVRYGDLPESRPALVAEYGPRYQLLINGEEGFHTLDGYVWEPNQPRSDDHFKLCWSPHGRAWALRVYIRRMTNDGKPFVSERLITSAGTVINVPEECNLHEWAVDEDGAPVAYVLSDGQCRRLYVHGRAVAVLPFIWGLTLEEDAVAVNVLYGRNIARRRFQL